MDNDLINSQGNGPIIRRTASDRVAVFQANANSIYNKYTPFTPNSIGPSQPFVYTKLSDSNLSKTLTRYDSQAFPIGSTVRDLKRIGQYSVTGNGILFIGKQLLLQQQNSFNETRIYNPLSLLKATAKPGSLGMIDYPKRHLETSGGLLNFFKDALLSTVGFETKDAQKPRIDGTATGGNGVAYSNYAGFHGGARAGLLRFNTATVASAKFSEAWVTNPSQGGTNGGFLSNLGRGLINSLKKMIPSTNPLGAFGGNSGETWKYRPEYQSGKDGVYYSFISDSSGFLTVNARASQLFYNDGAFANANAAGKSTVLIASDYHKYIPQKQENEITKVWYADKVKISGDSVGVVDSDGNTNNLKNLQERMVKSIQSFKNESAQFKRSAERYSEVKDFSGVSYPSYKDIPSTNPKNDKDKFEVEMVKKFKGLTLDGKGFSKAPNAGGTVGTEDLYNALNPLTNGKRDNPPRALRGAINEFGKGIGEFGAADDKQSSDIIFFYFFDLINEVYIPFRATISSLSDQNSAEWEDISYLGRADKLFLYKGFSRDVNLSFTVYANSAKEMLPMWNRVSYLVGLTRPSKYTGKAVVTNENQTVTTTGAESSFIYPPMVTFRLGDMFYDQPCVIGSVSVSIPDDTNWESFRGNDYEYAANPNNILKLKGVKSRQLPMKIDVTVGLKMLEKKQSLGKDLHYGNSKYDSSGTETSRWVL